MLAVSPAAARSATITSSIGSNFVAGVEADFQGSTLKGTYYDENTALIRLTLHEIEKHQGLTGGAPRAVRLGYAFGNILPYVTGGFAYGRVSDFYQPKVPESYSWSMARRRPAGRPARASNMRSRNNLTAKIEDLYTDLGTWNTG